MAAASQHASEAAGADNKNGDGGIDDVISAVPSQPLVPTSRIVFVLATWLLFVPIALIVFFFTIGYFDDATLFRPASEALVRFTYTDPMMRAGCVGCLKGCPNALLQLAHFGSNAILPNSKYLLRFAVNPP